MENVSDAYRIFSRKLDECIKPVLIPPSVRSKERKSYGAYGQGPLADQGVGR
jgi:hypothetical protein